MPRCPPPPDPTHSPRASHRRRRHLHCPKRQRERYSARPPKVFTFILESCSRRPGISVHVAVETLFTMSRNMHSKRRVELSPFGRAISIEVYGSPWKAASVSRFSQIG